MKQQETATDQSRETAPEPQTDTRAGLDQEAGAAVKATYSGEKKTVSNTDIPTPEPELFSAASLVENIYLKVADRQKCATGLDMMSQEKFLKNADEEISLILKKLENGSYRFTRYKMVLIPKGPDKKPRKICIPSIRDRIVIAEVSKALKKSFASETRRPLSSQVASQVVREIRNGRQFDAYFKLDLTTFFASIPHDLLLKKLEARLGADSVVMHLIRKILVNKAYDPESRKVYDPKNSKEIQNDSGTSNGNGASDGADAAAKKKKDAGIPEGLSCSGLLADIYMSDVDSRFGQRKDIRYFRFVDDIFVLCKREKLDGIRRELSHLIKKKELCLNDDKTMEGNTGDEFEYLGYSFKSGNVSIRKSSIYKHELAIEEKIKDHVRNMVSAEDPLIAAYWYRHLERSLSRLCSGCKNPDGAIIGWMSYYRFIDDLRLLHHLDALIDKLYRRHNLPPYAGRRHVRAYYELNRNIKKTRYVEDYTGGKDRKKEAIASIRSMFADMNKPGRSLFRMRFFRQFAQIGGATEGGSAKPLLLEEELKKKLMTPECALDQEKEKEIAGRIGAGGKKFHLAFVMEGKDAGNQNEVEKKENTGTADKQIPATQKTADGQAQTVEAARADKEESIQSSEQEKAAETEAGETASEQEQERQSASRQQKEKLQFARNSDKLSAAAYRASRLAEDTQAPIPDDIFGENGTIAPDDMPDDIMNDEAKAVCANESTVPAPDDSFPDRAETAAEKVPQQNDRQTQTGSDSSSDEQEARGKTQRWKSANLGPWKNLPSEQVEEMRKRSEAAPLSEKDYLTLLTGKTLIDIDDISDALLAEYDEMMADPIMAEDLKPSDY